MNKTDLMPFCSTDVKKPTIMQPWTRDGRTYATDGRIAIRVGCEVAGVTPNPAAPNCERVFVVPSKAIYVAVPDLKGQDCYECSATGRVQCTCRECGDDHERDCPECDGHGSVFPTGASHVIGKRTLAARYLAMIRALPGAEIAKGGDALDAAHWRFYDGDGMLMPVRKRD